MAITFLKEDLEGAYKDAYERVELYALTTNMGEAVKDEMLMNLLDSLLNAQKKGKPVEKIVGKDIEQFCKDYFQEYGIKERLKESVKSNYNFAWGVLILEVIDLFVQLSDKIPLLEMKSDMSGYLLGFVIAEIILLVESFLVRPLIFKFKKVNTTGYSFGVLVVVFAMLIGGLFATKNIHLEIPLLPVMLIAGIYILIYIIVQSVFRYRKTGSIRKEKDPYKEVEKEAENRTLKKIFIEGSEKRMHRINKRLRRKGKEELTSEAFMEKLYNENKDSGKWNIVSNIAVGILYILLIVFTAKDSTPTDIFILAIILPVVYMLFFKFFKSVFSTKYIEELLEECKQRGITIFEYKKEMDEILDKES